MTADEIRAIDVSGNKAETELALLREIAAQLAEINAGAQPAPLTCPICNEPAPNHNKSLHHPSWRK